MKRKVIITLIALGLVTLIIFPVACSSGPDEAAEPETQTATVQRGDITVDITAVGNLALSCTEDLDFDIFYAEATVEEVLVEAGDTVEQGQLLVTLDTSEWEDELNILEDTVTDAEQALTGEERDLLQREIDLKNAGISLENAKESWLDTNSAGTSVKLAEKRLEWALEEEPQDTEKIARAEEDVEEAWERFFRLSSDYTETEEVTAKEMALELAGLKLEDAREAITDTREALEDAREDMEEALDKSPEITAPFAGFITAVNVEGGDEILPGTVAVQLADPGQFEAYILVSEMDILQVSLGAEAWVEVDALQGMSLPAAVTRIAPTATIQSGVVNYEVKVEIQSLEAMVRERQEAMQQAMADIAAGEIPEQLRQAIESGQITQEQVEEMMEQRAAAGGEGAMGQHQGSSMTSAAVPEDFQLREGLTVTVTLIVAEANDVLLVPNAAITTEGGQSYAQVITESGDTEQRAIQAGISNYQFTEVTGDISEGEEIIVPEGTSVTPAASSQGAPRMMFFGGGPPH
ncbi:efflux RND transporter periplasmic adaptor subunit [Chloroflexota bacterium]